MVNGFTQQKILVVEDEELILKGLVDVFVYHGFSVDVARDGESALELSLRNNYDLIVLDIMLPGLDGYRVCTRIREAKRETPIIILTARSSEEDIVNGFSLGADDYLKKPFSISELLLRVKAILKRTAKETTLPDILELGNGLCVDCTSLQGKRSDSEEISFSRREMQILRYLHAHGLRPVSRGELLIKVWGYRSGLVLDTRTVDIHIAKLRKKIEPDPKNPSLIVTVRSEGYQLMSHPQ